MRRCWIISAVGLVLAGTAALWFLPGSKGAALVYEGKPVDQWLDGGFEDASRVLHDVGPAAAETIFAKLKREDSKHGRWGRYRAVWSKAPARVQQWLPRPRSSGFDEWRASHALLAIGPRVMPTLSASLRDDHFLVRSVSAQTLGMFRQKGLNISAARPALREALRDPDAAVREKAAAALGPELATLQDKRH